MRESTSKLSKSYPKSYSCAALSLEMMEGLTETWLSGSTEMPSEGLSFAINCTVLKAGLSLGLCLTCCPCDQLQTQTSQG